jgi:hypothetical protein
MSWTLHNSREQAAIKGEPYDRWISPQGHCMAEFYKDGTGFLIRFPGQGDFSLEQVEEEFRVSAWPIPDCDEKTLSNLFYNAIEPILGNHSGGLFLHGSAVVVNHDSGNLNMAGAVAFLGLSRGGKTTLAGSLAQSGFPFLTEDVIDLRRRPNGYWLQPKRSKLRLFADSARYLLGESASFEDDDLKRDVEAGRNLPFSEAEVPLRQIYVLGADHQADLSICQLSNQRALSALMPHAFILDVTDKGRLKGHFGRMADLSQDIPCYALDFTRDYAELPRVRSAILECYAGLSA